MVNSGSWLSIIFMSSKETYVVQIGVVEPYPGYSTAIMDVD